jgi:hypothetical protein
MIALRDLGAISAMAIGLKVWHDLIAFFHHRERVRAYQYLIGEGMALIRLALQSSVQGENAHTGTRNRRRTTRISNEFC